jgi:hypothetical protein
MATETLLPSGFTTNTWTSGAYTDCNNGVDTPTDGNLVLSTENEGAVLLIDFADVVTVTDSDTVSQVDVRYRGNYGANSNDGVDVELLISSSVVGAAQSPALTGTIDNYTLNDSVSAPNWNQDFTAAQLNSIQVRVTTTQGGMPSTTDLDLSEIEVVITYTAGTGTVNEVTITGANNYAATTDPSTKAERFRNTSLSDYIQKVSDAAWIPDVFSYAARVRNRVDLTALASTDDKTATYVPGGAGPTINNVTVQDLDSCAVTDFSATLRLRDRSQVNSFAVADNTVEIRLRDRSQVDSADVSDSSSQLRQRDRAQADTLDASDASLTLRARDRSQGDTLTVDDVNSQWIQSNNQTVETIDAADDSVESRERNRLLTDSVVVLDDKTATYVPPGSVTYSVTVQDLDSVAAADFATELRFRDRSQIDSAVVVDDATATYVGSGAQIYSRTLQDLDSVEVADLDEPLRLRDREQTDAIDGRTNLQPKSEALGTYFNTNVVINQNAATAPNGTLTAERVNVTNVNGIHTSVMVQTAIVGYDVGEAYAVSCHLKYDGEQYAQLAARNTSTSWAGAVYDLIGGTVTKSQANNGTILGSSIEALPDDWFRCSLIFSLNNSSTAEFFYVRGAGSATPTFSTYANITYNPGAEGKDFFMWGAQVEKSDTLGAYIRTPSSAPVTEYLRDDSIELRTRNREQADAVGIIDSITATYVPPSSVTYNRTLQDLNSVAVTDSLISIRERVRSHIESLDTFDDISASALRNRLNIETVDVSDSTLKDIAFSLIDALDTSDSSAEIRLRYRQLLDSFDVSDNVTVTIKRDLEINEVTTTDTLLVSDTVIAQKIVKIGTFKIYDGIDELPVELGVESLFVNHGVLQETS